MNSFLHDGMRWRGKYENLIFNWHWIYLDYKYNIARIGGVNDDDNNNDNDDDAVIMNKQMWVRVILHRHNHNNHVRCAHYVHILKTLKYLNRILIGTSKTWCLLTDVYGRVLVCGCVCVCVRASLYRYLLGCCWTETEWWRRAPVYASSHTCDACFPLYWIRISK